MHDDLPPDLLQVSTPSPCPCWRIQGERPAVRYVAGFAQAVNSLLTDEALRGRLAEERRLVRNASPGPSGPTLKEPMRSVSPSICKPPPDPGVSDLPRVLLAGGGPSPGSPPAPIARPAGNRCVVLYELSAARRAAIRKRYRDHVALELPEKLPDRFDLAVLATPPNCHPGGAALATILPPFVIERPMPHLEEARAIVSNLEGRSSSYMPRRSWRPSTY